ncbi:hypothetical protein LJB86_05080, partial [Deltaproteobacteria bacterium OttesenSCG-928-M10]|nr:hypothetical protein [Deltaproteobacteria bacterium OttesenSCG-928-M10]
EADGLMDVSGQKPIPRRNKAADIKAGPDGVKRIDLTEAEFNRIKSFAADKPSVKKGVKQCES